VLRAARAARGSCCASPVLRVVRAAGGPRQRSLTGCLPELTARAV